MPSWKSLVVMLLVGFVAIFIANRVQAIKSIVG